MSEQIKDGGPAFPSHGSMGEVTHEGMTLRDYFAAKVAPALYSELCAGWRANEFPVDDSWADGLALDAYRIADAMLAAREAKS